MQMVENQKAPQPENEPLRLQTVALLRARHFPTNDPQATVLTMLVRVCLLALLPLLLLLKQCRRNPVARCRCATY